MREVDHGTARLTKSRGGPGSDYSSSSGGARDGHEWRSTGWSSKRH